jgi:hypothetical protein
MIALKSNPNVDNSDTTNYPDGRIKDNTGSGNGTGVNRSVYGDLHANISRLMRLYGILPNGLPDNETNGYQIIESLIALASKNDYIYPLTTNGTDTLNIDIKLSLMKDNEFLICLASANKTTETLIKGSAVTAFAVTYSGEFKANEYVRVIKTSGGVSIIRVADWNSLSAMATELNFLKKASQSEEDAGVIDTVATTPLVNKTTFIKRVIGADSGSYLATAIRNGLYPKEHFSIVEGLAGPALKSKNVTLLSWNLDRQFTVFTGLSSGQTILSITPFLECTTANNGWSIGDIITAPTPEANDSGGLPAQGIGVQFKGAVYNLFHVLVNDRVTVMQWWTSDGSIANPHNITNTSQWAIRFVILYI